MHRSFRGVPALACFTLPPSHPRRPGAKGGGDATVVRAGLRTPHLDGNTRLCTSTDVMALIETFGTDGDPGSYEEARAPLTS